MDWLASNQWWQASFCFGGGTGPGRSNSMKERRCFYAGSGSALDIPRRCMRRQRREAKHGRIVGKPLETAGRKAMGAKASRYKPDATLARLLDIWQTAGNSGTQS